MKLGPTAAAERMKRKNVDGQIGEALAEGERPPAQHPVQSAQRALVEEGEERPDAGKHQHQLVQLELEDQERRDASAASGSCRTIGRYSMASTVR